MGAATLFYLVRNEHALKKVTEEVRAAFNDVEEIVQGQALTGCTYLRNCIDEAMRLSPSVGGVLPREVLSGGTTIDGHFIPEGTVVGVPHYTIHHNEAYYPNAYSYVPERWQAGAKSSLSVGPRGCIGKGLAYVEMSTTLARTIWLYDMRKAVGVADPGEGRKDMEWGRHRESEFQLIDTFTSAKTGPMVEFRKVDRA